MRMLGHLRRFRTSLSRTRRRLRDESGFALIEVVVSAGLLMVVAGGVLAGIDGPANISGRTEARSQASAIAQDDMERMRSMPFNSLVGYTNTTAVPLNGATYSRTSTAIWVRDNSDPDSCSTAASNTSGDYLKITSTVTPPGGGQPVTLTSLLAAPPGASATKGVLAMQIKDQLDNPVVAQSVSITGPVNMTVATNAAGCAVFGLVDPGSYTITFSKTGWLDPSSNNVVTRTASVTPGSTMIVTHNYAPEGTITALVDTKVGNAAATSSPAQAITVSNINIPTGTLTFPAPASPPQGSSTFTLKVYPFPSGYSVWAGKCTSGNPFLYGQPIVSASPGPAPSPGVTVTVRQPAITVTGATGIPSFPSPYGLPSGTHLVYTSIDGTCTEKRAQNTTAANGVMLYPGMPYGNWKLCADSSGVYGQKNQLSNLAAGLSTTVPYAGNGVCS
jgi:Tfp pilus assembly protein PilV